MDAKGKKSNENQKIRPIRIEECVVVREPISFKNANKGIYSYIYMHIISQLPIRTT